MQEQCITELQQAVLAQIARPLLPGVTKGTVDFDEACTSYPVSA
jgi:hypothetical protein